MAPLATLNSLRSLDLTAAQDRLAGLPRLAGCLTALRVWRPLPSAPPLTPDEVINRCFLQWKESSQFGHKGTLSLSSCSFRTYGDSAAAGAQHGPRLTTGRGATS